MADFPTTIVLKETAHVDQAKLIELADGALLDYRLVEEGLEVTVLDQKAVDFWYERAGLWEMQMAAVA